MAKVYVEHRELAEQVALTWDIAHHLYARQASGTVVIIAENPIVMLAALRKQWLKIVAKLHKEYSRTLSQARRTELLRLIQQMESLPFVTTLPPRETADRRAVYILAPTDFKNLQAVCHTLYIACPLKKEVFSLDCVVEHGLLVDYRGGGI